MSLYCPRCEKPLNAHDENGQCPKRLSRRFFLGALGSAFGAAALAKYLPNVEVTEAQPGSLFVTAAPRVHQAASIRLDVSGNWNQLGQGNEQQFVQLIESVARNRKRPVIGMKDGEVVHFVDPVKERLL